MVFEVYKPRVTGENMVAITKHHIRIGPRLLSRLMGDDVEVAYDSDKNILRIKGVDEGGLKLSKTKIGAQGIFKYFNLDVKGKYRAEFDEKEDAIFVDLNS